MRSPLKRLWPFALCLLVCLPGLLGALDWLENSDVLRYANLAAGRGADAPWAYRPLVPWVASLLPVEPLTALRVVSLACTLGALAGVLRIVEHVGGERRAAALLFVTNFGVIAYGASGYTEPAILCALAWGTWAVLAGRWWVFAGVAVLAALAGEKAALLPLVALSRPRWALAGAVLFVAVQMGARGGVGEVWAPSAEMVARNAGLGRWVRIALTLGVPAVLAARAREAPRPLLAGLAGVAALLVFAALAARVDGRFALLALPFTVPMAAHHPWHPGRPRRSGAAPLARWSGSRGPAAPS